MCAAKRVKAVEMFSIVSELLQQDRKVWITVTGMSMYPFLREDKDSVELSYSNFNLIQRGDIVLIRRRCGDYVLHRVLVKESKVFYIVGDAQQWIEGPLEAEQLIASVVAVRRGSHTIDCKNLIWKLLTGMWLFLIPIRHWLLKFIQGIYRVHSLAKKHRRI